MDNNNIGFEDFQKLKKFMSSIEIEVNSDEMQEFLSLLICKLKLHINAIETLLTKDFYDPFSIIPLARLCMETCCIFLYIKEPVKFEESEFRWLVWMIKSYQYTKASKYNFEVILEGRGIFDEKFEEYKSKLSKNIYYIKEGSQEINDSFLKKHLPGYEELYKKYFFIGKIYNQFSWVAHPSAIGCAQIRVKGDSLITYTKVIIFELNTMLAKILVSLNLYFEDDLILLYSYNKK